MRADDAAAAKPQGMEFRVLGPLEVLDGGSRRVRIPGAKTRALLAELVINANKVVSVDRLVEAIWGDSPPETAAKTLQTYVLQLRKAIEPDRDRGASGEVVVTRESGYMLAVDSDQVDAIRFERLVGMGREAFRAAELDRAASAFSQALSLWRGRALSDLEPSGSMRPEAARLEELRLAAGEDRIEAELALGHHSEVVAELHHLVAQHPLRERLWQQLMLALYRAGRQADALRAYQQARATLIEEIGIEPGPELRQLEAAVLAQDPALDLHVPAAVLELPAPLAAPSGTFVGRTDQLAQLLGAWDEATGGNGKLILVAGPEGIGKTRLVAELAHHVHSDGALVLYGRTVSPASPDLHPFDEALRGIGCSVDGVLATSDSADPANFAAALVTFLRRRAAGRAILCIVDDIDRADDRSIQAVTALADASAGARLLALATLRDDALLPDGVDVLTENLLRVPPLADADIAAIASQYLGEETAASVTPLLAPAGTKPLLIHRQALAMARSLATRRIGEATDRALEARSGLDAMQRQIAGDVLELQRLRGEPALAVAPPPSEEGGEASQTTTKCPYKGLARFEASDAEGFFGRERLVADLVARVVGATFLAIVGPSGSGKSSLARAGLLPALRDGVLPGADRWAQLVLSPGAHPAHELVRRLGGGETESPTAEALGAALDAACAALPSGGGLLVFVDQFEEVFTACADPSERDAFLDALVEACRRPAGAVTVIVTLRSDYYGQCASNLRLAELLATNHVLVGPMSEEDLGRAIERPADRAGLQVEPGLVEALVSDVAGEPGALPLLSTALLEAWEHRRGKKLRLSDYEERGGVQGAVARLAESAFAELSVDQQQAAERVLLRLAEWDGSDSPVRRRVSIGDLTGEHGEAVAVVATLTNRRLLTSHEAMVEVAHEALLWEWPRLRSWLDEDRQGRRLHAHLRGAAEEWDQGGRDRNELYRGPRLVAALDWAATNTGNLGDLERAFLAESRAAAEREADEVRQRAQQQAIANRRLRALVVGLVVVLTAAVIAGALATVQQRRARHQALLAESRRIAAQATVEASPDRALLLAREASNLDDSADTRSSLLANLVRSPQAVGVLRAGGDRLQGLALSPDGTLIAAPDNLGRTFLWDLRTRTRLDPPLSVSDPGTNGIAFAPDGSTLLTSTGIRGESDGAIVFWDVASRRATGERLRSFPHHAGRIAISGDGRTLLSGGPGELKVWDLGSPGRPSETLSSGRPGQMGISVSLSDDGRVAARSHLDGTVQVWDLASRTVIHRFEGFPGAVAVNPAGSVVAVSSRNGTISLYDTGTGERGHVLAGHTDFVWEMRFSRDGSMLASGGDDSTAIVWDVASGARRETLRGHTGRVLGIAFSPDARTVYTTGLDGTVMLWELTGPRRLGERVAPATSSGPPRTKAIQIPALAVSPDARLFTTTVYDGTLTLRRIPGGEPVGPPLKGHGGRLVNRIAFSRDGRLVAAAGDDGTTVVWNVGTGDVVARLEGGHREAAYTVAWSPDGRFLATGGTDGRVVLWHGATGTRAGPPLRASPGEPFQAPGGGVLGGLYATFHPGAVNQVAFSPDGRWLLAAVGTPTGGEVVVWSMPSRALRHRLAADSVRALTVSVTADSRTVASAGNEGKVRLWDLGSGTPLGGPLEGHAGVVHTSAFSPDGRILATAGTDGSPILWDVHAKKRYGTSFPSPGLAGNAQMHVAFTPDGRHLIAVYQDGQAWRWDSDPGSWRARPCSIAGRNLTRAEWQRLLPGRGYRRTCEEWPAGS